MTMPMPKKVTDYLKEVKYGTDTDYVPSTFALEMLNLIKLIDGGMTENVTPSAHLKLFDSFINTEGKDIINLCHRGFAKTSALEYLIYRVALYGELPNLGKIPHMIFVGDTIDGGVKKMRKALEYRFNNSDFLQQYLQEIKFTDIRWEFIRKDGSSLVVSAYGGKALALDTLLYTPHGVTSIGECRVGDTILGADGLPTRITYKSEVFNKPTYKIEFRDGRELVVCEDHLNQVLIKTPMTQKLTERTLTTKELLQQPLFIEGTGRPLVWVEDIQPLQFAERDDTLVDHYTVGLLLGDGSIGFNKSSNSIPVVLTAHKDDWVTYEKEIPYALGNVIPDRRNSNVIYRTVKGIGNMLYTQGLCSHGDFKKIPENYLYCPVHQRLALLQGLMDSDGNAPTTGKCTFSSNSKVLVGQVMWLVRSLGGQAYFASTGKEKHFRAVLWLGMPLFRLPRKLQNQKPPRYNRQPIVSITQVETVATQCIAVDNEDHQFVASEGLVRTHNTNIRGTRENGSRPVLALLDDIITDADARSPTETENIKTNINSSLEAALHPKRRKIIWNGTPFNAADPLYVAVESGAWLVNVYPICEKFPCTREEFRGSWEDRFSYDYVTKMYEKLKLQGALASFYQELMLQILSDDTRLISETDLKWYSKKVLMEKKSNFNFYITTDFATSEKQFSDYSFISVWAVNNKGFKYWVDGICKRQTMDKNIDDLFKFVQIYNPQSVGIEVSGQQGGFVNWIEQEMMRRNIYFSMASDSNEGRAGIRPTTSKLQRFNVVVPYFKMGEMYFPIEEKGSIALDELLDELSLTTVGGFKSKHDDALDTVSMLALMSVWLPNSDYGLKQGKDGIWGSLHNESSFESSDSYFC